LKGLTLAVLTLVILLSSLLSPCFASTRNFATVLIYHKFNTPKSPSTSIDTDTFEAQLRYLRDNNFNVLSMSEFLNFVKKGDFPPRSVLITIDDGYRSVYEYAYPLLKKYGFPFTVFLYMEGVGRYPDYMTVEQMKELLSDGVTLGNHSYTHRRLARPYRWKDQATYISELKKDFEKSENRFKRLFGTPPVVYAYPYGEYNDYYRRLVKKRGYLAAFTQDSGAVSSDSDHFLIPRNPIVGTWASMRQFRRVLQTEPLHVRSFSPSPGVLEKNPPSLIYFTVDPISTYKNLEIYISELGWLSPIVDRLKNRVYIKGIPALKREINRIGLSGIDSRTGRKALFLYMVISPPRETQSQNRLSTEH